MRIAPVAVFAAAVVLFLPTIRYGWVQDDRAIIALNPAVHSIPAALRALDKAYWPPPSQAGLYRPVTILSYAVDWQLSGGRPGWLHGVNTLLHAAAAVLVMLVLARWLPGGAAMAAGLVFAVHPAHVEGVASLVSRAELLVAVGLLGAVLAARRGWWTAALSCAAVTMFSKEHGVITGVVILLDNWLQPAAERRWYPTPFYVGLALVTVAYLLAWALVGRNAVADVAPPFLGDRDPETGHLRKRSFGPWMLAIFRILAASGYRGWVSIEDGMNGMDEMAESLAFLRRMSAKYFPEA